MSRSRSMAWLAIINNMFFAKWFRTLTLATLILFSGSISFAKRTVNVLVSPPRGGYGDTAANLLMIERLAAYYQGTDTEINMVVPKKAMEQVKVLWPDFDPSVQVQKIRDITVYQKESAVQADFVVSFSATPYYLMNENSEQSLGKRTLNYFEYGDFVSQNSPNRFNQKQMSESDHKTPFFIRPGYGETLGGADLNTGFANGLYVLEDFRPDDFNKEKTLQHLQNFAPTLEIQKNAKLGYAYASSPELAQQYLDAAIVFARQRQQNIVIVTNQPLVSSDGLVQIIKMENMPFDLNQKVIKSSDVPILVTGDGSLSLAIEAGKPFFYSLYSWKFFNPILMKEEMLKRSAFLRKNRKQADLFFNLLRLDTSGSTTYSEQFLSVFENPELQTEISLALKELTKEDSLVKFLEKDMKALSSKDKTAKFDEKAFVLFWQVLRKSKDVAEATKKMENYIANSRYDAYAKLYYMRALFSTEHYTLEKCGLLISKVLTSNDSDLKFHLSHFIQDNHEHEFFKNVLSYLTEAGLAQYLLVMKNLAAQSPAQWGAGRIQGAEATIKKINAISVGQCKNLF